MLFNTGEFAVFLIIVFSTYWLLGSARIKKQNVVLLLSSYIFYGWWDYRFLFLLIFSTVLDYASGIMIERATSEGRRRMWLWISVGINLGFLAFFKYFNFFIDSFALLLTSLGLGAHSWTLNIILPVGISFYTFHGLSYVFDIYKRRISAVKNFVDYSLFVSFFPLLVAGPIERATHLLPQIQNQRRFTYEGSVDGFRQILWGLFKKVVIADNCAETVNLIFNNSTDYSGSTLLLGAVLFAFQIYGDFSGYSDIALGTARLFGFELLKNFAFPYFSRDIAEFWRRWHISLSSWFRDYLYVPLGGSKGSVFLRIRNTFVIFLVSGFWHGANWTFIAWGTLNAFYFLPLLLRKKNRQNLDVVAQGRMLPNLKEFGQISITFSLTVFAWIFFRAESLPHAFGYIRGIFTASFFSMPEIKPTTLLVLLVVFVAVEWIGRENNHALEYFGNKWWRPIRWVSYYAIAFLIFYWIGNEQEFIYFQF